MSRIGKAPVEIPAGVTVQVKENVVTVKGPKGELSQEVNPDITVKVEDGHVSLIVPCMVFIAHLSTTWLLACRKAIRKRWSSLV